VPDNAISGNYFVKVTGDYPRGDNIVTVYAAEMIEVRKGVVEIKILPRAGTISPGKKLMVDVQFKNLELVDANVDVVVRLIGPDNEVIATFTPDNFWVRAGETATKTFELDVPEDAPEGSYFIDVAGSYSGENLQASTSSYESVLVKRPAEELRILGIPLWLLIAVAIGLVTAGISGTYARKYMHKRGMKKKRFEVTLFADELPQAGPNTIKFGSLAELKRDAFLKLDDVKMHMITAGATGGGKTISSMVIAEEALLQGKNVIVFDPTAQWTGFLRKCTAEKMLSHYPKFGLKDSDARSFPGVVKMITDPRQKIDMKELLGEETRGKITIFVIERLKPGELDIFVTNTIQSIFASRPLEYPELKTLLIYDECHRLLPKFGGSGAGEIQLERAVREFRKWGMGVMLVSQTIADFAETIKTNTRTQILFWTREESELARISAKYGDEHVRSVSKAPIGFGMVVNPDYNKGRPYYVNFRPILHSPFRLTPEELDKYYQVDDRVENVKFKLKKLEEKGIDVFDLRIELGLAQRKLEEASFDMVNAYLDSLEPRVEDMCARHKLKEIKRVIELVPEDEIKKAQMSAIRERERMLAMAKKTPEIVEAYREMLGPKKEVTHGEVVKPLKEGEKTAKEGEKAEEKPAEGETLHPDAQKALDAAKKAEEKAKKEAEKKPAKAKKAPAKAAGKKGKTKTDGGILTQAKATPAPSESLQKAGKSGKTVTNGGIPKHVETSPAPKKSLAESIKRSLSDMGYTYHDDTPSNAKKAPAKAAEKKGKTKTDGGILTQVETNHTSGKSLAESIKRSLSDMGYTYGDDIPSAAARKKANNPKKSVMGGKHGKR
jgi:hypothetical protein